MAITNELKMPSAEYYILTGILKSHQSGGHLGSLNAKYIKEIEGIMVEFAADAVAVSINNLNKGNKFSVGGYTISPAKKNQ